MPKMYYTLRYNLGPQAMVEMKSNFRRYLSVGCLFPWQPTCSISPARARICLSPDPSPNYNANSNGQQRLSFSQEHVAMAQKKKFSGEKYFGNLPLPLATSLQPYSTGDIGFVSLLTLILILSQRMRLTKDVSHDPDEHSVKRNIYRTNPSLSTLFAYTLQKKSLHFVSLLILTQNPDIIVGIPTTSLSSHFETEWQESASLKLKLTPTF